MASVAKALDHKRWLWASVLLDQMQLVISCSAQAPLAQWQIWEFLLRLLLGPGVQGQGMSRCRVRWHTAALLPQPNSLPRCDMDFTIVGNR